MVSGDTCLIVKNWTFFPTLAIGGGNGVVSTISSVAIVRSRNETTASSSTGDKSARIDGHRRRCGCTVPSISRERSSRLLAFSTGESAPLTPSPHSSRLDHSYPHSLVLHPSFLLSLNSRRATARIPRYVLSLVNFPRFLPPFLSPSVRVVFSCFSFLSVLRSLRSEGASNTLGSLLFVRR